VDDIPFISGSTTLFNRFRRLASSRNSPGLGSAVHVKPSLAMEFLNVEMPELVVIDFSDKRFDSFGLLYSIMADPWIFHGGVIALCGGFEQCEQIETVKNATIISAIQIEDMRAQLPRILDIVRGNTRILFQRELGMDLTGNISGSFKIHNDPLEASCFANLISNFLCNSNRIDLAEKPMVTMAIYEMLINAIEHGNCGIGYREKSDWLAQGHPISELIRRKCAGRSIAARRVTFEYSILPDCARLLVADEGKGFDWREYTSGPKHVDASELHGRGIGMAQLWMRNLEYNASGTQARFEIPYRNDVSAATPSMFKTIATQEVKPGSVIFRNGEPGAFMYYIVKGRYDVIVNKHVVSSLSPDDVFMGEMSFLLNNRRSATVKARTAGSLIPISKQDFVEAVKRKPHYALFLSRLLAQRIQRLNQRATGL
jgi:anti-sigma regulatory factor (Ser/Thr protein kinase)